MTVFRKYQEQDETLQKCWTKAENDDSEFVKQDELLWRCTTDRLGEETTQLCVPKRYRSQVLSLAHRPGHLGLPRECSTSTSGLESTMTLGTCVKHAQMAESRPTVTKTSTTTPSSSDRCSLSEDGNGVTEKDCNITVLGETEGGVTG